MHICIISDNYPSVFVPHFPFVKQLCESLTDLGIRVSVVSPQNIIGCLVRKIPIVPTYRVEKTRNGNDIEIYSPRFISLGSIIKARFIRKINFYLSRNAITKVITTQFKSKPDVIYGHFWHKCFAGYESAKKLNLPLFVATGEETIILPKTFSIEELKEFSEYVRGVICVSTKNLNESIECNLTTIEKSIVLPNAINTSLFRMKDKLALRQQKNFSQKDFIIAFVGFFNHRKGANRLAEAIKRTNDTSIKSIFIGSVFTFNNDIYEPDCDGILYKGPLSHEEIADYLNCADIFVLPTLAEGCCNAIIEAMACGLPIISSNLPFNYDILDSSCSILIDPMNIDEITQSIIYLKSHPQERECMAQHALAKVKNLTLENRTKKIYGFIKEKINDDTHKYMD